MSIDGRRLVLQSLRWFAVVLLLTFAWRTVVAAGGDEGPPGTEEARQQIPPPKRAPAAPPDEFNRGAPRTSVEGYIGAIRAADFERAAEYLDLRNLQQGLSADDGPRLARELGVVFERALLLEPDHLSDDPEGYGDDGQSSYRDYVGSLEVAGGQAHVLLQRVPRGDGVSIWKFSNATVRQIPALYDQYGYGPVAERLVLALPDSIFLGLRIWQWGMLVTILAGAWIAAVILTRLAGRLLRIRGYRLGGHTIHFLYGPLRFLITVLFFREWVHAFQPPVRIRNLLNNRMLLILVVTWVLMRFVDIMREFWSQKLRQDGRDQVIVLLRPLATAVKVVIMLAAVVLWLDNIGFEVTTLLTGLGLGGVALALAAQKSMEDIFGAVTLFTAAPVRVGDFCRFGDRIGTVEEIGLRVTRIRTLDRTVVTVPNAQLAAMQLENYRERDRFRYAPRLRLRYGTSPDQVRYVIVKVQELFHAHPKVIPPPAKARFTNFVEQGLEFDVFTYVDAASFDEFQEVAEDLNLRVMEIVREAGTDFAVPEQRIHVDRGRPPDGEAARAAGQQVEKWREKKELSLPHPTEARIEEVSNTLEYPPEGAAGKEGPRRVP